MLAHSMELGCQLTYHGPPRIGKLQKRLDETGRRLTQLRHIHGTLVNAGIYSVLKYGMELIPLGPAHADSIRQQLVTALLGASRSRNSYVAVSLIPGLQDPFPMLILHALLSARRFLMRASPETRQDFYDILASHDGTHHKCKGPAGCLSYYLLKLGWSTDRQGRILVSAFIRLPLLSTGPKTLARWVTQAWMHDLLLQHADRRAWTGLAPIQVQDTVQVLRRFDPPQQMHLLDEIAGAFQTRCQQAKWDTSTDTTCAFCDQEDTREHRIMTCSATAEIRACHQPVLDWLEAEGLPWVHLPVIQRHVHADYVDTLHHLQPEPVFDQSLQEELLRHCVDGKPLVFYTDGSCQHPHSVHSRFAGYSIVVDLAPDDATRLDAVHAYNLTQQVPPFFRVIALGRVQGTQTIHRAELTAIVLLAEAFDHFVLHSDSANALSDVQLSQSDRYIYEQARHEHPDLLARLRETCKATQTFCKVKAHQLTDATLQGLDKYHALGNHVADLAASRACCHLYPDMAETFDEVHRTLTLQCDHLYQYFRYVLDLRRERAILDAALVREPRPEPVAPQRDIFAELAAYNVLQYWRGPPVRVQRFDACAWGPTLAWMLQKWLARFAWPEGDDATSPTAQLGVAWVELAVAFCLHIGCWLPVKRTMADGSARLVSFASSTEAAAHGVTLGELGHQFALFFKQVQTLCATELVPPMERRLIRSLFAQGATFYSYGFALRPVFPDQDRTARTFKEYLPTQRGQSFVALPSCDMLQRPDLDAAQIRVEIEGDWDAKLQMVWRAARLMKQVDRRQNVLNFAAG